MQNTKLFLFIAATLLCVSMSSCDGNENVRQKSTDPLIVSVNPSQGRPNTVMTILGRNFSANASEISVKIGNAAAVVMEAYKDKLLVVIPEGQGKDHVVSVELGGVVAEGPKFSYLEQASGDKQYIASTIPLSNDENKTIRLLTGICFTPDGSALVVTDRQNHMVWECSFEGRLTPMGTLAGSHPWQGCFDPQGNFYFAAKANNTVRKIAPDLNMSLFAGTSGSAGSGTKVNNPMTTVSDSEGNIYLADRDNKRIAKITPDMTLTTFADLGISPNTLAIDPNNGNMFTTGANTAIRLVKPDGSISVVCGSDGAHTALSDGEPGDPLSATIGTVWGMSVDDDGILYMIDGKANFNCLRMLAPDEQGDYSKGTLTTIVGNGKNLSTDGSGVEASLATPYDVVVSGDGKTMYIVENEGAKIRKISLVEL